MVYFGLPMMMWRLFVKSFSKNLVTVLEYDQQTSKKITKDAKSIYKEVISELPKFEKKDRFKTNIINCGMVASFVKAMPKLPSVEELTIYYEKSMMTKTMNWFCRKTGKNKFSKKDIESMKKTANARFADRNPYSWNMNFIMYEDNTGYEARFYTCGICKLMKRMGFYELTPALCHLDYSMSEAGERSNFKRMYTLASGGPYCDCGYQKRDV